MTFLDEALGSILITADRCRALPIVDHFDSFEQNTALDPDAAIERYFIRGDMHWNETGHEHVAQEFLDVRSRVTARTRPGTRR